jgi:uncharacterized phage protein gp47/JayE
MPFSRPTLTQLRDQAMQDVNAAPIGVDGFLRFAVVRVLAWVQAAMAYLHYGYLDWIALMSVPWSAEDEYAAAWGAFVGVEQNGPGLASGTLTFSGSVGATINADTQFALQSGTTYVSTSTVSIVAGATSLNVPVVAMVAGSASNADAGTSVKLSSPVAGIVSPGVVAAPGITGGTDQETTESFRDRYLAVFAAPPQGGDREDYIQWATAVGGVTRAWVNPNGMGAGTVVIYTMFDQTEASNGGFPRGANGVATNETRATAATGDQLAVANAIFPDQPVTALVYSCAPTNAPQNFSISGLGANNTTANQQAITASLAEMFLQNANVGGTINPETGAAWGALDPSLWYATISAALGASNFVVSSPSGPLTPSAGQLFTLGTITFAS